MKVKNTGPDVSIFGLHFAEGRTVEVPATLAADKQAHLARNFEVIADAPVTVTEPEPVEAEDATEAPAVETEPEPKFYRRPRRRRAE